MHVHIFESSQLVCRGLTIFVYVCVTAQWCLTLCASPWTAACLAPLSMGFPKQEYWSGLSFPSSGDLPNPGIELASLALAGGLFTTEPPGKP